MQASTASIHFISNIPMHIYMDTATRQHMGWNTICGVTLVYAVCFIHVHYRAIFLLPVYTQRMALPSIPACCASKWSRRPFTCPDIRASPHSYAEVGSEFWHPANISNGNSEFSKCNDFTAVTMYLGGIWLHCRLGPLFAVSLWSVSHTPRAAIRN